MEASSVVLETEPHGEVVHIYMRQGASRERLGALVRRDDDYWYLSEFHRQAQINAQGSAAAALQVVLQARALQIARALVGGLDG
jgi:hypothetical protein